MMDLLILGIFFVELVNTIRHWNDGRKTVYFPTSTTTGTSSTWNYYEVGTQPPPCQADNTEET